MNRPPVSGRACLLIKEFALRFSKELFEATGHKIRGNKLYNACVKPLGYDSFAEVKALSSRINDTTYFEYQAFFSLLKNEIRNFLPITLEQKYLIDAIKRAEDPGHITVQIMGADARQADVEALEHTSTFQAFVDDLYSILPIRPRQIKLQLCLQTREKYCSEDPTSPIEIIFDYSRWKNESDPIKKLHSYKPFLKMLKGVNGASLDIDCTIKQINTICSYRFLNRIDQYGRELWGDEVMIVDVGHRTFDLANHKKIVLDNKGLGTYDNEHLEIDPFTNALGYAHEVFKQNTELRAIVSERKDGCFYHRVISAPSGVARSFLLDEDLKSRYAAIFNSTPVEIDFKDVVNLNNCPVVDLRAAKGNAKVMTLALGQVAKEKTPTILYTEDDMEALMEFDPSSATILRSLSPHPIS
ncbi:hypothetical protein [Neptuniibacter sp. QD37_11]|uniref:hypothetical protein n=1 Tax=Neptuniibacter sp. QD37_11 TaxID=3398209 RepID=UPI0039F46322